MKWGKIGQLGQKGQLDVLADPKYIQVSPELREAILTIRDSYRAFLITIEEANTQFDILRPELEKAFKHAERNGKVLQDPEMFIPDKLIEAESYIMHLKRNDLKEYKKWLNQHKKDIKKKNYLKTLERWEADKAEWNKQQKKYYEDDLNE